MKKKIGIVADSSSGLTKKDFEEMKDLGFCPLLITFNEEETVEDDPRTFDEQNFIERIATKKQLAKTSQTPIGKITSVWDTMLKQFEKIIFVPLSKGLSGQYNTACVLAKEAKYKNKVYVFDSNGVSIINLAIVKKAYKMAQKSDPNVTTILTALKKISDNYQAFILPNDITYLARGGRISKSAAGLAKMLKIKPILSFDGTIDKFDTTRTWKKAVNKTLNEVAKFHKLHKTNPTFYLIDGYANKESIDETRKYIESYNFKKIENIKLANVIAAHTGLNAFAFVTFAVDEDTDL
ncbi:MAG: DegV family protein [Spiroplasma sp.]|nr:DegV family protein [Spiroplasma sp.]